MGNVLQIYQVYEMLQWISNWIQYNWTNSIPHYGNLAHLYLKRWFEMRELNKKNLQCKKEREGERQKRENAFYVIKSHI